MSPRHRKLRHGWLADAIAAFDGEPLPPRPDQAQVLARLQRAQADGAAPAGAGVTGWGWNMRATRRWLLAAGVLLAACAVLGILTPLGLSPSQALAQMVANVRQAGSFMVTAVWAQPGRAPVTYTIKASGQGRIRQESGPAVTLADVPTGRGLHLDAGRRTAVVLDMDPWPAELAPYRVVEELGRLPVERAQFVEETQRDGRRVLVYQVPATAATDALKLWVDRVTLLPVRLEVWRTAAAPTANNPAATGAERPAVAGRFRGEFTDFAWNVALDAAQFNLAAPEDYRMIPLAPAP